VGIEAPHDTFFRAIFRHAAHTASWLAAVLPATIAGAIDWRTLVVGTDTVFGLRLHRHQADLVFTADLRGGDGLRGHGPPLLLLIEHKAQVDAQLPSQLLRYAVHLRRAARRHHGGPEPLVLGIVLHHGATSLPETPPHPHLADLPDAVASALAPLQPQMSFVVDDLAGRDERTLWLPGLTPTALLARYCLRYLWQFTGNEVLTAFARWADLLRAADREHGPDTVDAVCWYALAVTDVAPEALIDVVSRILLRPEDTIMSTLERTYQKGLADGLARGEAAGEAKAQVEARTETLLRLLAKRFGPMPPAIVARVRTAGTTQLDRWIDRLLDATSLDSLFAD
jgi:hypothetical protein